MKKHTDKSLLEAQILEIQKSGKKRVLSRSRLNRHMYDILSLHLIHNASNAHIALWLRQHKRIKVSRIAVHKFIKKHLDSIEHLPVLDFFDHE